MSTVYMLLLFVLQVCILQRGLKKHTKTPTFFINLSLCADNQELSNKQHG